MSTILEALQKQSNGHSGYSQKKEGLTLWKAALLVALVVIISLLSILLYMQLANPEQSIDMQLNGVLNQSKKELIKDQPIVVSENPDNIVTVISKPVKRITFVTQPLPEYEVQQPLLEASSEPLLQSHQVVVQSHSEAQTVEPIAIDNNDIDYSDVSSELKQRFQRALEKGQEQGQQSLAVAMSSSSDIHQMSVKFQKQVPIIRYDSHMYSTLAADRRIRINGEMLKEGQFDSRGEIELVEILPNQSVFRFGMQSFTLESLMDWQGY